MLPEPRGIRREWKLGLEALYKIHGDWEHNRAGSTAGQHAEKDTSMA